MPTVSAYRLGSNHINRRCWLFVAWAALFASGCEQVPRPMEPREPCLTCHESDLKRPTFPNHLSAGFPTACEQCHTADSWSPAKFKHDVWPLEGKHRTLACAACHSTSPAPTTCVGCHSKDAAKVTSPRHDLAGFPTDCSLCHTPAGWTPSTFAHSSYFPISSAPHNLACLSCHNDPKDFKNFSCIDCHMHRQDRMDRKHKGVTGYSFTSAACLKCHPKGTR